MHELIAQPKMLLVVIVYLLALVGTGAYFAKKAAVKKEGKEDFFLSRKRPWKDCSSWYDFGYIYRWWYSNRWWK